MRINIEIERLVLNGFDFYDHKRISVALEQELARLIMEKGLPRVFDQGGQKSQIYTPSFKTPADLNPRTIGAEVARSIYRSWQNLFLQPNVNHHESLK